MPPTLAEIERRRVRHRIKITRLLAAARVHRDTWRAAQHRPESCRASTLARLDAALTELIREGAPFAAPGLAEIGYRTTVALLAAASGCDAAAALKENFAVQRPANKAWLEAARLRRLAIYVLAEPGGVPRAVLGAALGCSRQNIAQAIEQVRAQQSEPEVARLIDKVAAVVTGRG